MFDGIFLGHMQIRFQLETIQSLECTRRGGRPLTAAFLVAAVVFFVRGNVASESDVLHGSDLAN